FTGGGSGGHLYPGIALAQVLADDYHLEPHFLCGELMAERILSKSGFASHSMPTRPGQGAGGLLRTWHQLTTLVRELKPVVTIGLGGGASLLPALVSLRSGAPLFVLEQNRVLGRTNRWLLGRARRGFLSFPGHGQGLRERHRCVRLGCPVRRDFVPTPLREGPPHLLILGGSQGSEQLNQLMQEALPYLGELGRVLSVTHVCGPGKNGRLSEAYAKEKVEAQVMEYLENPIEAFREASLVLARAGGSTVAELAAVGRGALLLPYPHHRDRQQFHNAAVLEKAGAAEVIAPKPRVLAERLRWTLGDAARLHSMARQARQLGLPQAAREVARVMATHLECATDAATVSSRAVEPEETIL
ncbi:MAG: UDP-N-acetylglucosamine--N-acetylmuramyl-(pentapeptide) pyrophosphoryl-undecaprenol N-acetylglucosamine transferase, partial [Planctomycetota bacterium]